MAQQATDRRIPRVFFTGAQSTGKTTLLNHVLPMFPSLKSDSGVAQRIMDSRNLNRNSIFLSSESTMAFQGYMIEELKKIDQENEAAGQGYISDRSPLDPVAYAILGAGSEVGQSFQEREEFVYFLDKLRSNSLLFLIHPSDVCVDDDGRRKIPIMEEMIVFTEYLIDLCRHHKLDVIEIKTIDIDERVQQVHDAVSTFLSTYE